MKKHGQHGRYHARGGHVGVMRRAALRRDGAVFAAAIRRYSDGMSFKYEK